MDINLDAYYRGQAAERLQALGDELLRMAGEAGRADAHDAAMWLADLSTQLLDMGLRVGGQHTPPAGDLL
ncbi:hypothetical protein BH23ACT7_BH23ACT7_25890 [soil metagenome]|jgi:hypothetical protein|nr:hypothetical protein [Euzebyaceae bacterium]